MTKIFKQVLLFLLKVLEIWELEKISLPTAAAFKEDTNMFSTEFREGFGLWSLIMAIQ